MEFNQKEIAERISYLRQVLRINQSEMAILLGVTQPAISKYLNDRVPPPFALLKLARAAGTSIEWILTGVSQDKGVPTVAEPDEPYILEENIQKKIVRLPKDIQKDLETLIDSILNNLNQIDQSRDR
jgi:transcriptional regulator with XRE-family HTH domain